jgi:transposase-like protein
MAPKYCLSRSVGAVEPFLIRRWLSNSDVLVQRCTVHKERNLLAHAPKRLHGERLFTFLGYPPEQWKSLRTTNAIERLHEEFKRRIKTQCALPNAETAAMLFCALMASGQITMRRVVCWQTLAQAPTAQPLNQAA